LEPGRFVVVDQFIDRTVGRPSSFFTSGMVAHVSMVRHSACSSRSIAYSPDPPIIPIVHCPFIAVPQ